MFAEFAEVPTQFERKRDMKEYVTIARSRESFAKNPRDWIRSILHTIESDRLNSFIEVFPAEVLSIAQETGELSRNDDSDADLSTPSGVLAGVPFGVKNNIDVGGHPAFAGSDGFLTRTSSLESPVVTALKSAGCILAGTLNMHELALGTTSANAAFGFVKNPHDTSRSPGGSSGGSAAAVASGLVAFALGSDTGGSCRIPAAYCGIVGFRPTTGRYSDQGLLGISPSRDTIGVLASSVADVTTVDSVITGEAHTPTIELATIRLGVPRAGFYELLSREVELAVSSALEHLSAAGVTLVETEIVGSHECREVGFSLVGYEAPREILRALGASTAPKTPLSDADRAMLAEFALKVASPDVADTLNHFIAEPISEETYEWACAERIQLQEAYARSFAEDELDAIVYPTVGIVAPVHGEHAVLLQGTEYPLFPFSIRNTDPGSIAGQPSLSIPLPRSEGELPIGLGIEGARGNDRELLALADVMSEALQDPLHRI